jgi:UDP-N-acetylglucosamine diphosphorylase/glucosamine-1-phosphate N-acetyltransferase
MHVVIFEDALWKNFAPLTLSRPVFSLVAGLSTLSEKLIRNFQPKRLTLWVRPEMEEFCKARLPGETKVPLAINQPLDDEPAMLVNGRAILPARFDAPTKDGCASDDGETFRYARLLDPGLAPSDMLRLTDRWKKIHQLPKIVPQGRTAKFIWDLIAWGQEILTDDAKRFAPHRHMLPVGPIHLVNEKNIWAGEELKLGPGCVLDAGKGPIVIGDHVVIGPNCVIEGPAFVGSRTTIVPLTLLRPGTSIGPECKIGGEVSNATVIGFSNKSHFGYLGDSYVGEWVNLGAGTSTSNLKNTYGEISIRTATREIPTGRQFLGSLIGDHTKTAILTRLMTGTYVGYCCMLAGTTPSPRFVKSLTFWTDKGEEKYRLDNAIEVAKRMFARRDRKWTPVDEKIMRYVESVAGEIEK